MEGPHRTARTAGGRELIRGMCRENPLWGAPRIHGELLKLGIDVGETSVGKYMRRHPRPPSQTWRTFLRNHLTTMVSVDFFTVPTIRFQVLYDVRIVRTPFQAPNCNARAERFVRSIKGECPDRMILFGERHLRRDLREFVTHYHRERNHQGLSNELIDRVSSTESEGRICRRPRLGGLLNFYDRAA
jgi:hypothetical protein